VGALLTSGDRDQTLALAEASRPRLRFLLTDGRAMVEEGDAGYEDFGDPVGNVPFEMDYVSALDRAWPTLTVLQRDLLSALVVAPDNELSAGQIARLLGLAHHAGVNSAIVSLAKALTKAAGVEPPKRSNGSSRWWHVVAEGRYSGDGRRFLWRLRPALVGASLKAGFGTSIGFADAQEEHGNLFVEGALKTIQVNAYERNPVARRRCIEHYGMACSVCGHRLGAIYGPIAEDVIHVHHLRPLSECGGTDYEIDPIAELRPVCPNCHVVLHLRRPPYSIEDLRAVLADRRD
jgi:predicted HNH restriction endonuclease